MKPTPDGLRLFFRAALLLFGAPLTGVPAPALTALDRYVARPDASYEYHLVQTNRQPGFTAFILEMTSQSWRTTNEVDRILWKHWLVVTRPDQVAGTNSLLLITGGGNGGPPPAGPDENLARIAVQTHSVVSELHDVPNQPLTFAGEDHSRHEDSFIAYTWDKYLRTGDETWPARLPMTKAAVRAMDTVVDFTRSDVFGGMKLSAFVVAGASKRGWTTWTTAAVDKRVIGIIPIVIDVLNVVPSFKHHFEAYGFWAPAVNDYVQMGIMEWMDSPQYHALMTIEDPFEYRDRFTMPKFLISAADDQFFLPDSSQFYFDALPGVKYLRYVPNADHSLRGSDAMKSVLGCYQAILDGAALPKFAWRLEGKDGIEVTAQDHPGQVLLWQATNENTRDFRLETVGAHAWKSSAVSESAPGVYLGKAGIPSKGWTAEFLEVSFPGKDGIPFKFTTQVRVVPDTLPFPAPVGHGH